MEETRHPSESASQSFDPPQVPASDSSSSSQTERFAPGVVIGDRYRIVSQLGRGGMGEVYRADDQRLGTSVALKFLPVARSLDPLWRDRLLREVRVAREVTHANVCRVFDLAEHDGQFFLSMEYIDGEDLSSLLRRIGRFPEDKALEIARQICLGLAAAHEEGVLHRDLKPANVMLDGRGRIKLTDFGLAAMAEKVEGAEARSGTLAYMAPEQKEGREVTRKSDIYSLGLVLHEVFTGKPFDPNAATLATVPSRNTASRPVSGSQTSATNFVLDPAISRVVARCLKQNPEDRPNTAFAVAALLPGGDPLQAALAAGETPSPEMVAEAGGSTMLSKRLLNTALAIVFIGAFASCWMWDTMGIGRVGHLSKSPEALTELSRQVIKEMGYSTNPADSVGWLESLFGHNAQYRFSTEPDDFRRRLKAEHPATWEFSYRQSSWPLIPTIDGFRVFQDNVPEPGVGDILVKLSGSGQLIFFKFKTRPWLDGGDRSATQPINRATIPPGEVAKLSRLTGLPLAEMPVVPPIYHSGEQTDQRFAWLGTYPAPNDLPVRVEVGRLRGRIIYVNVIPPWNLPAGEQKAVGYQTPARPAPSKTSLFFFKLFRGVTTSKSGLIVAMIIVCAYLAIRHVRADIADLRGGTRLALFAFAVDSMCWMLATHFPADLTATAGHLIDGLGSPAINALMIFVAYIALEPFVRSHWPEKLIAWSRILDGRHRDRLVASEILIGLAAALVCRVAAISIFLSTPNPVIYSGDRPFESFPHAVAAFGYGAIYTLQLAFLITFTIALMRRMTGKAWLSYLLALPIVFVFVNGGYSTVPGWMGFVGFLVPVLVIMATIGRFGLLSLVVCCCTNTAVGSIPVTLSTSSFWWTSTAALVGAILLVAVLAWKRATPDSRSVNSLTTPA